MELKLVLPSAKYAKGIDETRKEILSLDNEHRSGGWYVDNRNIEDILKKADNYRNGIGLPEGIIPATDFWIINEDDIYVGRISVRHELTENLRKVGGHIGYNIRPSQRRNGYATKALELALIEAKKIGLTEILITCDKDNVASKKVIESNGGVFQNEIVDKERNIEKLRYTIDLHNL